MRIWVACVVVISLQVVGCGLAPDPATDDEHDRPPMTGAPVKSAVKPGIIEARKEVKEPWTAQQVREVKARMLLKLAQRHELRNNKKSALKSYQRLLDGFGDTEEVKSIAQDIEEKIEELEDGEN